MITSNMLLALMVLIILMVLFDLGTALSLTDQPFESGPFFIGNGAASSA